MVYSEKTSDGSTRIFGPTVADIPDATTAVKGKARFALLSEALWGTANDIMVSPQGLLYVLNNKPATTSVRGTALLSTQSEALSGTDTAKTVTPAALAYTLANKKATETAAGTVELATPAEATAGSNTQHAVTPAGLKTALDDRFLPSTEYPIPMNSGYVTFDTGANYAVYTRSGDYGYISGLVKASSGTIPANSNTTIGVLPPGFRPKRAYQFASTCQVSATSFVFAWVFVDQLGQIAIRASATCNYVSLSVAPFRIT